MLVNTVSCKSEVILRGHDNLVTECHYLKSEKKLISISDDKTFIVYININIYISFIVMGFR